MRRKAGSGEDDLGALGCKLWMRLHFQRWQRWGLVIVAGLWLGYLFEPGLGWLISFLSRTNPVRAEHVQAVIPRTWRFLVMGNMVIAVKQRCFTRICTSSDRVRANVGLEHRPRLHNLGVELLNAAGRNMEGDGFSQRRSRSMDGAAGSIECIEGTKAGPQNVSRAVCYAPNADLHATFQGDSSELGVFYAILASAQTR